MISRSQINRWHPSTDLTSRSWQVPALVPLRLRRERLQVMVLITIQIGKHRRIYRTLPFA